MNCIRMRPQKAQREIYLIFSDLQSIDDKKEFYFE